MTKSARQVGVHEAKTHLSELLRVVAGGQEVDILRNGRPVAKIIPFASRERRAIGIDAGRFVVPDDFDSPLPAEVEAAFYR
jgi:prevent-host-death family protein